MMFGADFKAIREAIVQGYDEDELKIVLRDLMDLRFANIVGAGNFSTKVFELLEWSEREGREVELVRATALARPRNPKLQAVYQKYGMAIPVYVERAGATVLDSPTDATQVGLERTVRDHLTFADFGLWRERMMAVEGRVCQIAFRGAAAGTGFLVGPQAVLTNYHVMQPLLQEPGRVADVECVFDFKILANGDRLRTPVKLHPTEWSLDSSPFSAGEAVGKPDQTLPTTDELDYALVKLAQPFGTMPWAANPGPGAPQRGWIEVSPNPIIFKSPMGVIIAQHPNGWPMKLGIDTNSVDQTANPPLWVNANRTRIRYATNTEGGSSGSPVFDLDWNLIALHHYGDPHYAHPRFNQGIPIDSIRQRMAESGADKYLGE